MDKKTIWIINQYASLPSSGIGGRHYLLAQELVAKGNNVYLVMASFHHMLHSPVKVSGKYELSNAGKLNIVQVNVPEYEDAHSGRRMINWFIFAYRLSGLKRFITERPDAILYSSLSLVGFLGAERLARYYQVPLTFEVRDIWPLTLTEIGGVSTRHPFVKFLQWIEDRAYRVSDRVVSNLPGAVSHMVERGMDPAKFEWIPNGVTVEEMERVEALDDQFASSILGDRFVVGYAGTHGVANALDNFLDAASLLCKHPNIVLVLVGRGKEKERLQCRCKDENLDNVVFLPSVPKTQISSVLKLFDVCFIGWKEESLYRYGIGANKIPEYFFSGKPVIHAYSGGADPVEQFGAGLTVPAEDPEALAEGILRLSRMSEDERDKMGANGKRAVLERYDYSRLATRLQAVLLQEKTAN
ncbi:glycosyltransferase family 4 protein [Idiomarina abyssalis]|uniref:glycosyltransferase family 4 protein n=1 Tax=Idiomarina abyssalis TaxID=86102 RepID=UPI00105686A1|nr:glycosyltransferase family 4 protein [Marinobacter sp. JH2]QBM16391.1 hypothetical protein MARI_04710 [Marinobacter sp. JH2]